MSDVPFHDLISNAVEGDFIDGGWIPPEKRTTAQNDIDTAIKSSIPPLDILGPQTAVDKLVLWDFSKKVNGGKHFTTFYQQTGSCFPSGTLVAMADGTEKPIEEIQTGDKVLSHTGLAREVTRTFHRKYTGDMVEVKYRKHPHTIVTTADHDHLVVMPKESTKWRYMPGAYKKKKAIDLAVGEYVLKPHGFVQNLDNLIINLEDYVSGTEQVGERLTRPGYTSRNRLINRFVRVDNDFGRLLGLYLSEGCVCHTDGQPARVTFTYNRADEWHLAQETVDLIRSIFGLHARIETCESRPSVFNVRCNSKLLAEFLHAFCPGKAKTKRIPVIFFKTPIGVRKALLRGWYEGDGCFRFRKVHGTDQIALDGITSSELLARDIHRLATSCRLRPSFNRRVKYPNSSFAGTGPSFDIPLYGHNALEIYPEKAIECASIKLHRSTMLQTDHGYLTKIESRKTWNVEDFDVYCIEVEEEHTIQVNGIAIGQCVGNGGGQAIWYLSAMDNARLGKNIIPKTPFYLLPYGRSRFYGGMRGQGEGSFGSTFAKAVMQDGILPFDAANLPPMTDQGGLTWGKKVEYTWSDGARINETWLNQSRSFLVKSAAKCNSTKDVWDALANGYPCTIASSWGGQMRPSVQGGSAPVLLNRRVTTWQHQMCIIGIWNHPTLGRIFLVLNSWGVHAHGTPPDDAPPGSFWVLESEIDYIVRQDETFAFSQFVGFPAQRPNHWLI